MFTSEYDSEKINEDTVVIAGAGPAGLARAIALKKINSNTNVVVLEKRSTYTRNQVANITKSALLSMVDLEPRILFHLMDIGRAFFFDEHILMDLDTSVPDKKLDMRPFQKTFRKVLGQSLPRSSHKKVRSLKKLRKPYKKLNEKL